MALDSASDNQELPMHSGTKIATAFRVLGNDNSWIRHLAGMVRGVGSPLLEEVGVL